jgi:hypothetical protein
MTESQIPPLIAHLEKHLGVIANGSQFVDLGQTGVQVVRFDDVPFVGAVTFSTLGLSRHQLHQFSEQAIWQEQLLCAYKRFAPRGINRLLYSLALGILERHHAPARGDLVGPAGPIFEGSTLEAFYFTYPSYFSDGIATFSDTELATVFVWAVPIAAAEVRFIAAHGWKAFEDILERKNPGLLDLGRSVVVSEE